MRYVPSVSLFLTYVTSFTASHSYQSINQFNQRKEVLYRYKVFTIVVGTISRSHETLSISRVSKHRQRVTDDVVVVVEKLKKDEDEDAVEEAERREGRGIDVTPRRSPPRPTSVRAASRSGATDRIGEEGLRRVWEGDEKWGCRKRLRSIWGAAGARSVS